MALHGYWTQKGGDKCEAHVHSSLINGGDAIAVEMSMIMTHPSPPTQQAPKGRDQV